MLSLIASDFCVFYPMSWRFLGEVALQPLWWLRGKPLRQRGCIARCPGTGEPQKMTVSIWEWCRIYYWRVYWRAYWTGCSCTSTICAFLGSPTCIHSMREEGFKSWSVWCVKARKRILRMDWYDISAVSPKGFRGKTKEETGYRPSIFFDWVPLVMLCWLWTIRQSRVFPACSAMPM